MTGDVAVNRQRLVPAGFVALLVLAACGNAPSTSTAENANAANIRRVFEDAWNNHNAAAVTELYSPTAVGYTNGVQDTMTAEAFVKATLQTYPDAHVEIHDIFSTADKVVMRWTWSATAVPSTNKGTINGVSVTRFVDGKIVEEHAYYDVLPFSLASGATLTPPPAPPAAAATTTGG